MLWFLLGKNGQTPSDARRLKKASSLDGTLRQLNSIWGADDSIFAAHIYPLYDNEEDPVYRQHLKDPQQNFSAESRSSSTMPVKVLMENVFISAGE